jgi:hypothetical protein
MCKQDIKRARVELVEINVPANQPVGLINWPNNLSNLTNNPDRKVFFKDIEVIPDYSQTNSVRSTAIPVMPVTEFPKISVTLYYNGENAIRYIPLANINYTVPPGNIDAPYQRERVPLDMLYPVEPEQCFLQFNAVGAATAYVVVLSVNYIWTKVKRVGE